MEQEHKEKYPRVYILVHKTHSKEIIQFCPLSPILRCLGWGSVDTCALINAPTQQKEEIFSIPVPIWSTTGGMGMSTESSQAAVVREDV